MAYFLEDFHRLVEFDSSEEVVVAMYFGDRRPGPRDSVEGRIKLPGRGVRITGAETSDGTDLHGTHLRCGLRAVKRMEADHPRLGAVRMSKRRSSRRMTPFPAAASCTSSSCGTARASGARARARKGQRMGEEDESWESECWTRLRMSHALLLRLFLSPSFFSVHVALRYLLLYADNIGITYYLTRRLSLLDPRDLRDVWGFVWCASYLHISIVLIPPVIFSSPAPPNHARSSVS